MSDIRERAEARLSAAAAELALAEPMAPLRERLRTLRESHRDAYDRAVRHYTETVQPALLAEDPVTAWLDYGRFIGELTSNGRLVHVDATGRAAPWRPPTGAGALVLFVPEDNAVEAFVAIAPAAPTPAQEATVDLLVHGRLGLRTSAPAD